MYRKEGGNLNFNIMLTNKKANKAIFKEGRRESKNKEYVKSGWDSKKGGILNFGIMLTNKKAERSNIERRATGE